MGTTEISAPAGVPFIDISREFDARAIVYRACTGRAARAMAGTAGWSRPWEPATAAVALRPP
jgi:antirestriction protein ArdC